MTDIRTSIQTLRDAMCRYVIGQQHMVDSLLLALLADGHLLVEGLPGLAKTRAVKGLARNVDASLSRVQFTPDLLPSDVTGSQIYQDGGEAAGSFQFDPGPIFANLVLADEINRAPAKVQAALLEAMEERQVTVAGESHQLPELFLVLATQNPIEQEGTYPLPEAQMDRFLMKVVIGYPDTAAEKQVLALVRGEERGGSDAGTDRLAPEVVLAARREVCGITVASALDDYIVALVDATRHGDRYSAELGKWIEVGASPRGTLALDRCARARAWLQGRDHALPDDVRAVAHDCLRHRLILGYEAEADGVTTDRVIDALLELVALPA